MSSEEEDLKPAAASHDFAPPKTDQLRQKTRETTSDTVSATRMVPLYEEASEKSQKQKVRTLLKVACIVRPAFWYKSSQPNSEPLSKAVGVH